MNVWVFLGSLFILVCVCTVVYAICKLVSIVDETHDRTDTLARIAVKDEKKVSELDNDLSALAERVYSDSAEIAALHDHFDDLEESIKTEIVALHDHFDDLEEKIKTNSVRISALTDLYDDLLKRIEDLEKGGAQIERKTGRTGKEG